MANTDGYLLDTNILIHLIRGNQLGKQIDATYDLRANLYRNTISVVSVGEVHSFGLKLSWGQKKVEVMQSMLKELVWVDVNCSEVLQAYGEIDHYSEKVLKPARPMGQNDMWIAACAKATGATFLTTDKDFDHLQGQHIKRIWIAPVTEADI
ncbi:MAG: type II toxin-antitoxin system VapC family toxin [Planctomycetota bacterium]|nr:type II toxin-antitoxin system VapC family toxin [Planctomycetota bacterium]MDA1139428.1 type II toxin-antitoxin system VapC family toxin [Planctomycetota bacterium]